MMIQEKEIYKVECKRFGNEHGYYEAVNVNYEEEFDNLDEAQDAYDECLAQMETQEYDYLLGEYPLDCLTLSKDDEVIESFDYEIREDQYRED